MPRYEHGSSEGHQGWRNYETWAVALWLDNEQSTQEYWREIAQNLYDNAEKSRSFTKQEQAVLDLAKQLKEEIDDNAEGIPESGLYADLLNAALSEVYWMEIAEHIMDGEEITDEDDDDEDAAE